MRRFLSGSHHRVFGIMPDRPPGGSRFNRPAGIWFFEASVKERSRFGGIDPLSGARSFRSSSEWRSSRIRDHHYHRFAVSIVPIFFDHLFKSCGPVPPGPWNECPRRLNTSRRRAGRPNDRIRRKVFLHSSAGKLTNLPLSDGPELGNRLRETPADTYASPTTRGPAIRNHLMFRRKSSVSPAALPGPRAFGRLRHNRGCRATVVPNPSNWMRACQNIRKCSPPARRGGAWSDLVKRLLGPVQLMLS